MLVLKLLTGDGELVTCDADATTAAVRDPRPATCDPPELHASARHRMHPFPTFTLDDSTQYLDTPHDTSTLDN
jgi:hypothetical protein